MPRSYGLYGCAKGSLLLDVDVVTTFEHDYAVISVGVDLPPHMRVGKFDYLVGIIASPEVIAVKLSLINNI